MDTICILNVVSLTERGGIKMSNDVFNKHNISEPHMIVTQKEMAELLGVSVKTLIRWDKDRSLIARRRPNGLPFYIKQDYYDYLVEGQKRGVNQDV